MQPPQRSHETAHDEIVIGNFERKSKNVTVKMLEKMIEDKDHNPKILMDKIGVLPKMIPIKFDTKDFAELFERQHTGRRLSKSFR